MADLIERQAAIDVLSLGKEILSRVLDDIDIVGADREKYSWGLGLIESYINDIEELPSAQPEIIRCKDCKLYRPMNRETKTGICKLTMHQNFGDNWFCAGAERKTDD